MPKRRPRLQKTYTNERKKKVQTYKSPTFTPSMAPVPVQYLTPIMKLYIMVITKFQDELGRFPYQSEIAEHLQVSQQGVSKVLKTLVLRGWVMRVNKFRWALARRLPREVTLETIMAEHKEYNPRSWKAKLIEMAGSTPKHTNTKIFLDTQ